MQPAFILAATALIFSAGNALAHDEEALRMSPLRAPFAATRFTIRPSLASAASSVRNWRDVLPSSTAARSCAPKGVDDVTGHTSMEIPARKQLLRLFARMPRRRASAAAGGLRGFIRPSIIRLDRHRPT